MAWWRAACVGGNLSDSAWFFLKRDHQRALTVLISVFGWYIRQTSCSTPLLVPSYGCSPQLRLARACKIGVLVLSNSSQQVAFPFPEKLPVTSAPVNAWNAGSAAVLVGPRASAIDFKLITLRLLPVPVTKQELEHKSGYRRRAKTWTPVSGEYIDSWVAPWAEASREIHYRYTFLAFVFFIQMLYIQH